MSLRATSEINQLKVNMIFYIFYVYIVYVKLKMWDPNQAEEIFFSQVVPAALHSRGHVTHSSSCNKIKANLDELKKK